MWLSNLIPNDEKHENRSYKTQPHSLPTMMTLFSIPNRSLWICLWSLVFVLMAEKTVYLDRLDATEGKMWDPYFNPHSIVADVGEQVHFVARLDDIKMRYGTASSYKKCADISQTFEPFAWAFAESEYSQPCIYNQGSGVD
jgi:hypothetical protein